MSYTSYGVGELNTAKLAPTVLFDACHRLDEALRRTLKLRDSAETDLRKADFKYWIPDSAPVFNRDAWRPSVEESYVDIAFRLRFGAFKQLVDRLELFALSPNAGVYATASWETVAIGFEQQLDIESPILNSNQVKVYASYEPGSRTHLPSRSQDKQKNLLAEIWGVQHCFSKVKAAQNEALVHGGKFSVDKRLYCPPNSYYEVKYDKAGLYQAQQLFRLTIKEFVEALNPPIRSSLEVLEFPKGEGAGNSLRRAVSPHWDISFVGEYAKGFEPCDRPEQLEFEQRYPVLRRIRERKHNKQTYEFLDLQVTAIHPPGEDSYLLLHTQRDHEFLKTIAASAGLEITEFGTKGLHQLHPLPDAK